MGPYSGSLRLTPPASEFLIPKAPEPFENAAQTKNLSIYSSNMEENKHIAIIGSGLIGQSYAMIFASAGYKVRIYDIEEKLVTAALAELEKQLRNLEQKNILRGNLSSCDQLSLISGCLNLEEVTKDAFFLQECVPERLEVKRDVYKKLDELMDDKIILSTSTTAFMPSVLSEGLRHKSQFIVSHPVNPPYFVPLIEIVSAPWTSPEVADTTFNLWKKVGQVPVKLNKEVPGFVLNRIQFAIINECFNIIEDDVTDVQGLDLVMSEGLGMRYAFLGPFETTHLNAEGFASYCSRYGPSIYEVSKTMKPPQKLEGPTAEKIAQQLEKMTPLDKLAERRRWRDESLIKLSQLKKSN